MGVQGPVENLHDPRDQSVELVGGEGQHFDGVADLVHAVERRLLLLQHLNNNIDKIFNCPS